MRSVRTLAENWIRSGTDWAAKCIWNASAAGGSLTHYAIMLASNSSSNISVSQFEDS